MKWPNLWISGPLEKVPEIWLASPAEERAFQRNAPKRTLEEVHAQAALLKEARNQRIAEERVRGQTES